MADLTCQSCGFQTTPVLDFGEQPICNRFLKDPTDRERLYPLKQVYCGSCGLLQLDTVPPREAVFGKGFNYLSAATPDIVEYFGLLAGNLKKRLDLKTGDMVLDIGSNDGTFLKQFASMGLFTLGIDPAPQPTRIANRNDIPTICASFEDEILELRRRCKGKLELVTAMNVLAHTDKPHEFLEGVAAILKDSPGSTFVSQSHYAMDLIRYREWDTVYHEHSRFYSLTSLDFLLAKHGIIAYDAHRSKFYGGSFVVYAGVEPRPPTKRFVRMKSSEQRWLNPVEYAGYAEDVRRNARKLKGLLSGIKAQGKKIVGVGAPMKSSTLLNYCGIDGRTLNYLTEVNPLKVGTYSPGMHIPVREEQNVFADSPDYLLILSWNFARRIMYEFRALGYKGKFILPMPKVKVV